MIVELKNVSKKYNDQYIFKNINLQVKDHEMLAIVGQSGCGKSTLLNIIGLLDKPDNGTVSLFDNQNVKPFTRQSQKILKNDIGYLFQNYALIENETIYYNLDIVLKRQKNKEELMTNVLKQVGLDIDLHKKIYQCSGGEQQRIALARLLLKPCRLILADEPTGNLDENNKIKIFEILKGLYKQGKTVIIVTHDKELAASCPQIIEIKNHQLIKIK